MKKTNELIEYVRDKSKTQKELYHGANLSFENVYEDMMLIKMLFVKKDTRQALHWVLSHDERVPKEEAYVIADEVVGLISPHYQVFAATHINTKNCHTHFLINPVSIHTGKIFSESKNDMLQFREKINEILLKHGCDPIGKIELMEQTTWDEQFEENSIVEFVFDEKKSGTSGTDGTWTGIGSIENGHFIMPGVFYKTTTMDVGDMNRESNLIRGVYYDNTSNEEMEILQKSNGKIFRGKAKIEEGKNYISGIFYECD